MDGCVAFWELGCRIDWEAWSAIGAMLAAVVAVWVTLRADKRITRDRSETNHIVLAQLYAEARDTMYKASWCLDLDRQIKDGCLPRGYEPALGLALRDLRELNTHIYDRFGQVILQFRPAIAGVLISQCAAIRTELGHLSGLLSESTLSKQKAFDRSLGSVQRIRNSAFNIAHDLAMELGRNDPEELEPGPESYSVFAPEEDW